MKRPVIAVAAVLLLMLLTNPSVERHRGEFREHLSERSALVAGLGFDRLGAMMLRYESFGIASTTRMGDELVGVGLLGMVFILGPDAE